MHSLTAKLETVLVHQPTPLLQLLIYFLQLALSSCCLDLNILAIYYYYFYGLGQLLANVFLVSSPKFPLRALILKPLPVKVSKRQQKMPLLWATIVLNETIALPKIQAVHVYTPLLAPDLAQGTHIHTYTQAYAYAHTHVHSSAMNISPAAPLWMGPNVLEKAQKKMWCSGP